ncbi:MAG: 30S ribosomal protein S8 [Candidatus Delongbacteria bacterium]|nr:30S ribosomal protein S8 [Candidatus Delongbacteria bacterium]
MPVTDPIADLLTRIRNAQMAGHKVTTIPRSRMKEDIVKIMAAEGYIKDFGVTEEGPQGTIKVLLKYDKNGKAAINGMKRVSTPGLRRYVNIRSLPRVFNNLGIAIISTPRGVITNKIARREKVGGEVLCYIW